MQDLDKVRAYYCAPRSIHGRMTNIYEIWEDGGAYNDSVTPSTFSVEYRSHIVLKMLSLTTKGDRIISLGCGNGFVEAELIRHSRDVYAIDCNDEAIRLTQAKGVKAVHRDFFDLRPEDIGNAALVYADGFLGHVFHPDMGLQPFLRKLESLQLPKRCRLVFSNDAPKTVSAIQRHDTLDGFWFISKDYLVDVMRGAGFDGLESYYFPYFRPISGLRNRTICACHAGESS